MILEIIKSDIKSSLKTRGEKPTIVILGLDQWEQLKKELLAKPSEQSILKEIDFYVSTKSAEIRYMYKSFKVTSAYRS